MEVLNTPLQLLSLALILALVIERILEIIKSIYDYVDARTNISSGWTKRAEIIRDKIESQLDSIPRNDQYHFDLVIALVSRFLCDTDSNQAICMTVSADKIRTMITKFRFKILAIILGMLCAWLFNIDVLELTRLAMQKPDEVIQYTPSWYGITIAGIAMGLGSGPMHKLINALEKARELRKEN